MACGATLKRGHDFDYLLSPTSKPAVGRNFPTYCSPPAKRLRHSLPSRNTEISSDALSLAKLANSTGSPQSPFKMARKEVALKSDYVLKNIYDEYKRIKRRRQLTSQSDNKIEKEDIASSSSSAMPSITDAISASVLKKSDSEVPLLTIKQVGLICERLLKDQEEKITSEYEKILVTKLSEQYDAFVKFNYDQIQRRINEEPASYVS